MGGFAGLHAGELRTFEVRGVIEKLIPTQGEAVVRHEAIPGYMDAMTMPFRVSEKGELAKLHPGDAITFRLNVAAHDGWIDHIKVIASAPNSKEGQAPTPAPLPNLEPIQPGEPFPDATLTNEQDHELKLSSYRGKALAVTFIFTRCPFPNFCPRMTDNFAAAQSLLATDASGARNWQLLSITIDPEHDTPQALRAYAEQHKADPSHWHFATGSLRAITTLALRCGMNFWDENGLIQHNLRSIVIDPGGKVRKVFPENQWTPEELVREMKAAAIVSP